MSRKETNPGYYEHLQNAQYGFYTGFSTGGVISAAEFIKVKMQANLELTFRSLLSREFARNNWKGFAHTVPAFATFFGGACAIEFSVNSAVGEKYGPYAGLTASAFSGAFWLTPADHLMFRKDKGNGYLDSMRYFWRSGPKLAFTGFTPMVAREFLFGMSVLYTGPMLGAYIQNQRKNSNDPMLDLWWRFVGTLISAGITTTVSQPFDTLTRKMQIKVFENRYQYSPHFLDVVKENIHHPMGLYRGFIPRLFLASFGAASIGTLFKFFKENANPRTIEASANTAKNPAIS